MGTIREITKRDGNVMHHAEIQLRGHPPQRQSFRTKTQAKKWIQDTEAAIRDGRYKGLSAARKHTVGELIDRFIEQCMPQHPKLLFWPVPEGKGPGDAIKLGLDLQRWNTSS